MNIGISTPGAHPPNGLLELAGGNALTDRPNNVASIHGSGDRCRAIWAQGRYSLIVQNRFADRLVVLPSRYAHLVTLFRNGIRSALWRGRLKAQGLGTSAGRSI